MTEEELRLYVDRMLLEQGVRTEKVVRLIFKETGKRIPKKYDNFPPSTKIFCTNSFSIGLTTARFDSW